MTGSGPLVILQHGLTSNLLTMRQLANTLALQHFTCLCYDLYDRGWSVSTTPSLCFDLGMHVQQMRELLIILGLFDRPFVHIGHSLGGGIGIGYATMYPTSVRGICLIDAVILPVNKPLAGYVVAIPAIRAISMTLFRDTMKRTLRKFQYSSYLDVSNSKIKKELEIFNLLLEHSPRFLRAVISSSVHFRGMLKSNERMFTHVCKSNVPMHFVWGEADGTTPYAHCLKLVKISINYGSPTSLLSLPNARHSSFTPDTGNTERVAVSIVKFVKQCFISEHGLSSRPSNNLI